MHPSDFAGSAIWEYFDDTPGLVRHRGSGRYYSRIQAAGKRTMLALKTKSKSVAKLRHADKVAAAHRLRQRKGNIEAGVANMGELLDSALADYVADTALAEKSKESFRLSVQRLTAHWRECFGSSLREMRPARITREMARRFSNYLHTEARFTRHNTRRARRGYGAATVNKTVETLHRVLRLGVQSGALVAVPFELTAPMGQSVRKPRDGKKLALPSSDKMREVFAQMRTVPGIVPENQADLRSYLEARSHESADLAEFMAYTGARLNEAAAWVWEDERAGSVILRGTKTESSRDREVPKIPAMHDLLRRMKARRSAEGRELRGEAFLVAQCREGLAAACERAGVAKLTHHSLRHLFATVGIEAGIDVPTISRWLGHADGGVLAMKTYGHLRQEHSIAAAAKVNFGANQNG